MIVKHANPRHGTSTILLLRRYIYNGKEIQAWIHHLPLTSNFLNYQSDENIIPEESHVDSTHT